MKRRVNSCIRIINRGRLGNSTLLIVKHPIYIPAEEPRQSLLSLFLNLQCRNKNLYAPAMQLATKLPMSSREITESTNAKVLFTDRSIDSVDVFRLQRTILLIYSCSKKCFYPRQSGRLDGEPCHRHGVHVQIGSAGWAAVCKYRLYRIQRQRWPVSM